MVLKSYAKINLSLSVLRKLKNRLHDIQSIYCLINLYDKILIKKIKNRKSDKIIFSGPFSKNINKLNNSVRKVLITMRKNKIISDYYSIRIDKKIPVFAGFGGGTSNAATLLEKFAKKKIKKEILEKVIKIIGSDLRLFFYKQGYQKNINSVNSLSKKHRLFFLLAYPRIKNSTKNIYSKVKKYSKIKKLSRNNINSKKKFINYLMKSQNDLQTIVEKRHPIIGKLLKNISEIKGCYFSRMTGSGSACYGIFENKNCSIVALKKLSGKYPKFWFSIAKTI